MKKGNVTSRNALIENVVRRLTKNGYQVLSTRVGNMRPVIEIERPQSLCPGFTITTSGCQGRSQLNVAAMDGCLITWRA